MSKANDLASLISDGFIGTAELDTGAVTLAKLSDNSVDATKLDDTDSYVIAGLDVSGGQIHDVASLYRGASATTQGGIGLGTDGSVSFMNADVEGARFSGEGRLGLGTDSPLGIIDIEDSLTPMIKMSYGGVYGEHKIGWDSTGMVIAADTGATSELSYISMQVFGGEALHINSNGNIGIGTDSPSFKLHVDGYAYAKGWHANNGYSSTASIPNGGIWGMNSSHPDGSGSLVVSSRASTGKPIIFATSNETTLVDRARFTGIGDFIVGKPGATGPNYNAIGVDLTHYGEGQFTTNNRPVLQINRQASDGQFVVFRRDGAAIGYIGHNSLDNMEFGALDGGGAGLMMWGGGGTSPIITPLKEGNVTTDEVSFGRAGEQFKEFRGKQVNIDNNNIGPLTVGGTGTIVQRCNTSGSGYATKMTEIFSKAGGWNGVEIIFDQVGWGSVTFDIKVAGYPNKVCHLAGGYYENGEITGPNYTVTSTTGMSYSVSYEGGHVVKFTIMGSMTHPVCEATFTHGGASGSYIYQDASLAINFI